MFNPCAFIIINIIDFNDGNFCNAAVKLIVNCSSAIPLSPVSDIGKSLKDAIISLIIGKIEF